MKISKKLIIITLVMILTVFSVFCVYGAEDERPTTFSGKIGDNANYSISVTYGTETISVGEERDFAYMDVKITGSGSTYDYGWDYTIKGNEDKFSPIVYAHRVVGDNVHQVKSTITVNGVTGLGDNLFKSMNIGNTDFLNGVKTIGKNTFANCTFYNANDLSLPSSITSIGESSFGGLELSTYNERNGLEVSHMLTIPSSITEIPKYAFNDTPFTSVDFPDTLTYIGYYAFEDSDLKGEIVLPDSIEKLDDYIFANTDVSGTYKIPPKITTVNAAYGSTKITDVQFHENVTELASSAFFGTKIKSVVVPETVKTIGPGAFMMCHELVSVVLPSDLTVINESMFEGSEKLSDVNLPDGVEAIGERAFCRTAVSGRIVFPSGLKTLGDLAYAECKNLTELVFPEGFEKIVEYPLGSSGLTKAIFLGDEPEAADPTTNKYILGPFPDKTVVYYSPDKKWTINDGKWHGYTAVGDAGNLLNKTDFESKVNGTGTAKAKYRVVDDNGTALVNEKVTWVMYEGGIAHKPGEVPDSTPIITKVDTTDDQGYIIIDKKLDDDESVRSVTGSSKVTEYEVFVYIGEAEDGDVSKLTMLSEPVNISVTATPVSFTQTWKGTYDANVKASVGASIEVGNAKVNLASLEGGVGASPTVELTHKYDEGTRELELRETVQPAFSLGVDMGPSVKYEVDGKKYGGSIVSVDGSFKSKPSVTYGMDIKNYDPQNPGHILQVGKMLLGCVGMTNGSIFLMRALDALGGNVFDSVGYGDSFTFSRGVNLNKVSFGERSFGLIDIDADSIYTSVTTDKKNGDLEISHKKVTKSAVKLGNFDDKECVNFDKLKWLLNIKKALLDKELVHTEYSLKYNYPENGNEELTLKRSVGYDDSFDPEKEKVSRKDLSVKYSGNQYSKLIKEYPQIIPLVYSKDCSKKMLFDSAIGDICEEAATTNAIGDYSLKQTNEDSVTIGIFPTVGLSAEAFSLKAYSNFLGTESTEYSLTSGYLCRGEDFPEAENDIDEYVKAKELGLDDILLEAVQSTAELAYKALTIVENQVEKGVAIGMAKITSKAEEISGYYVRVQSTTGHSGGGHSSGGGAHAKRTSISRDLMINTYDLGMAELPTGGEDTPSSISSNDLFAGAATVIGESYYVTLSKDEAGTQVIEDFSTTPLTLTLGYNEDILKDAGMGLAAVPSLAIYEYCEAVKGYKVLESTADETAMTLTTQITHPGEYLLAVPYSTEQYKIVEQEYEAAKENGSKENALSEMKIGDSGYVVKYTGSVSFNSLSHIWTESKESKTKCADITVKLFDPQGQEVAPSLFKLKFKNNKNVNTNGKKTPSFTITLKGKVDKNTKRAFKKNPVKFEITPAWIGYCPLDYKKIKETSKGVKVTNLYYKNVREKKVKLKAMNKKMTKGDYTAELKDGKLLLKGYGNYRGEVLINPREGSLVLPK